ncbi:transmembrane protein 39A [Folsomia candida]|uniref:transmembrane protein 39A n=1 Tax=Folsomia candida TaxID=158441 RepID=UPI000B8F4BCA|nr:transmembrane protein 39A [Folsomia candida]
MPNSSLQNVSSRRLSSPSSSSSSTSPPTMNNPHDNNCGHQHIPVTKHIHLPPLPPLSPLGFDIVLTLNGLLFYALQLLHLYRTVWWLPQSFNSGGGGVHLHLISPHLAIIILTVMTRRIVYLILSKVISSQTFLVYSLGIGMIASIAWNAAKIEHLTWLRVIYLLGPIPLHLYTYGPTLVPLFHQPDYDPVQPPENSVHHTCTTHPPAIRQECEQLRMQFNKRIKSVFYSCFVTVYYGCFVPWGFCKPTIHYDLPFVTQHLLLSSCFTFTLISSRSFCPDITDRMHKVAVHLGAWSRVQPGNVALLHQAQQWSPTMAYTPSSLTAVTILTRKYLYRSTHSTPTTTADPLNSSHARFHSLFSSSTFPRLLLGFHLAIELLALLILFKTSEWYQLISVTLLLITSTPTLIRLGRDFLVVWKLYKAEEYIFATVAG